ncbi:MAG: peptidylprolyl isomerase [Planctomycetes bacterium]|nr:peptidylprolyl isomerase [Planctomycetota bacterium]
MLIGKNTVVSIDYTLTDPAGNTLDSSKGRAPLTYIQGAGTLIPGLEAALDGKARGDAVDVTIVPAEAYGERDPDLIQPIPRSRFDADTDIEVGMQFTAQTEVGQRIMRVVQVDDHTVLVDANHPLAGVTLRFEVKVVDVRRATKEELSHGHAHGPGGHHHH